MLMGSEPLRDRVRISNGAGQVWAVRGVGEAIAALVVAESDVDGKTGLHASRCPRSANRQDVDLTSWLPEWRKSGMS